MLFLIERNEGQIDFQVDIQFSFQQSFEVFGGHESMSSLHEMNKLAWSSSVTSFIHFHQHDFMCPIDPVLMIPLP